MSDGRTAKIDSAEYTEALVAQLTSRLERLRSLHGLSLNQADSVEQGDVNAMLGILARKQVLLDELAAIGSELAPYLKDSPDARVWRSPSRRSECRQIADEGNRLLREIIRREEAIIEKAVDRRDAVAAQLQDGRDSVLAHTAYSTEGMLEDGNLDITNA